MPSGKPHTTETFILAAKHLWGGTFDYSKVVYVKQTEKVVIGCPRHGYIEVEPRFHILSNTKFGCPECAKENANLVRAQNKVKKYAESFVSRAIRIHGDIYDYSKVEYKGQSEPVKIICKTHGEFLQKPGDHLAGCGCKQCGRERIKQSNKSSFDTFVAEANTVHGNKYSYCSETFGTYNQPTKIICDKHGEFYATPGNHISKASGCPKCVNQVSKVEQGLAESFPWSRLSDRKILKGKELDMVSDQFNFAVEVNGIYWHCEARGKDEFYHINKTTECKNNGYTLLQFLDKEIENKRDIVLSMINNKFCNSKKVYARKCGVADIDYNTASDFLKTNHLAGTSVASKCYGLFLDGTLLSVMTFSKPRFAKQEWEMIRFATALNIVVVGGASKLFKHFVNDCNPKSVVTYANLRYSSGGVYETLGFKFSHNSRPNYEYWKANERVSRYAAQKHNLPTLLGGKFDATLSERDNMVKAGYLKLFDCGNAVFVWESVDKIGLRKQNTNSKTKQEQNK